MADRDLIAESLGVAVEAPKAEVDPQAAAVRSALGMSDEDYRGDETDPDDVVDEDDDEGGDEDDERQRVQAEGQPETDDGQQETETEIQAQITQLRQELEAAKAEAEKGGNLRQMMNADPARFATALLSSLDAQTRQQILGAYGAGQAQEAVNPLLKAYRDLNISDDDLTPAERLLIENHDVLTSMPERIKMLADGVDAEFDTLYGLHEYQETVLHETLAAIGEALFNKPLPVPDYNAYREARRAGKDAKTAVAETYGQKLRETAKKPEPPKEKPRTPDGNNGGGGIKRPGPNASLDELVAYQLLTGTKERF